MYFQYFWTIDLFRIGNELYEKYSSSQANTHKHGIRFALKILNLYAAFTHIFFVLNLDFSKLGWNSKSLLIYTDLTKHAQLKITHKKTTFSHLRSTNAVLSLSMQSLTWYRLYIIIYITWSRNHSIWSHDENMKYFFTWYMTAIVCMKPNVWTIIKNASLPQWFARLDVLLTRIPTMWRKHVKKKIQTNPWSLAVLQILLYIIHIKIFKPSHAHVLK